MIETYQRHFGGKPRQTYHSPLEKGDHPEMDTTNILDPDRITLYQSLIGALQWAITLGRIDVMSSVVTMSSYSAAPKIGHFDRVKRIYGYLSRMSQAKIRVRTEEPDYSGLSKFEFDWSRTVYRKIEEAIMKDAPVPLGKFVTLSHFVDANLMHDLVTGRSTTGVLHLINKTPEDWFSKKQSTVEVATYSSEMVAMRTCVEQIIDLRNTLRYLGGTRVMCLVTMRLLSRVLFILIPSSTSDTICFPFILCEKRSLPGMFILPISPDPQIPLTF
jgi:hypothetical protein